MATNPPNRWQSPPNTAALSSSSASGSSSNSHLRDSDAQFIDFTPLPTNAPRTPVAHEDSRLLASQPNSPSDHSQFQLAQQHALSQQQQQQQRPIRTASTASFAPSPLNPTGVPPSSFSNNPFSRSNTVSSSSNLPTSPSRPASRGSARLSRHPTSALFPNGNSTLSAAHAATDDNVMAALGLGAHNSGLPHSFPLSSGGRGSMVLYRLADEGKEKDGLPPPNLRFLDSDKSNRASVVSSSSSFVSLADSKYPAGTVSSIRGLIPYAYDPSGDENEPMDDEDWLHDPSAYAAYKAEGSAKSKGGSTIPPGKRHGHSFPWRGIANVSVIVTLILALLCLFIFYPVMTFYRDEKRNDAIRGNIRVNGTGQAPVLFQMPDPIDEATPKEAHTRTGFDGNEYELVFSDEFEVDGRTFWPGDDPFWEAVDLWYGATGDVEWYDPGQVTTRGGALVITMDSTSTTKAGMTNGSTAPFTAADNHGLDYRSGMLQTWNKFCFTTGYIEVSATFPGPDQNTQGYWPGAWTMGNLARPGYPATTDGMWPYTYDSCDVGTFPNQTNADGLGPTAALHSDASRPKYNYALSWLSGQRLSACSCPGSDHPGPSVTHGRGAPEIDVFEAEKDKDVAVGHVVSQSAQFAPFSHDYVYWNDSGQWTDFDATRTRANSYRGSAVQQSVSGLTRLPDDMFQGSGANYKKFGFEYWSDPNDRNSGSITWQVDGQKSHRVLAAAVAPDQGTDGSGVGQRLIPEEPMSIVLNLGMSPNWQTIDLSTMMFPAELKFDYVRVYQRKGRTNTGCDPKDYPTAKYIADHLQAYTDVNMTTWQWEKPKNSLYSGGC